MGEVLNLSNSKTRRQKIYGGFEKEVAKAKLLHSPQVITCTILTRVIKGNCCVAEAIFFRGEFAEVLSCFPLSPLPYLSLRKPPAQLCPLKFGGCRNWNKIGLTDFPEGKARRKDIMGLSCTPVGRVQRLRVGDGGCNYIRFFSYIVAAPIPYPQPPHLNQSF